MLYIIIGLFPSTLILIFSVTFLFALFDINAPLIAKYVNQKIDSSIRTTALSMISFIKQVVNVVIKLSLAIIISKFSIETGLIVNGIYLLIGITISYYLIKNCH